jgi:Na+-driven multidrug efflux pump
MTMGETALRVIGTGFIFSAVSTVFAGVFEALGRGVESLVVSLLRQLVIIVPVSLVLVRFLGVTGVWISFTVAEIIAMVISIILLRRTLHRLVERSTNS